MNSDNDFKLSVTPKDESKGHYEQTTDHSEIVRLRLLLAKINKNLMARGAKMTAYENGKKLKSPYERTSIKYWS